MTTTEKINFLLHIAAKGAFGTPDTIAGNARLTQAIAVVLAEAEAEKLADAVVIVEVQ